MRYETPVREAEASFALQREDANLPYVLLLGDSISMGYTLPVRVQLEGICNVLRPESNCGDTVNGLAHLETWLGERSWDLIHFNWGLHDFCYRRPEFAAMGDKDKVRGQISVPPETYRKNLQELVESLQPRARRLVWASTTYVPEGEPGRFQGDEVRYNAIAADIMTAASIPVNDLYALTKGFSPDCFVGPGDVHYADVGNELLAKAVVASIRSHLPQS